MRRVSALLCTASLLALASPAFAQEDNAALQQKMERLERDINFLQKQVYRGGAGGGEGAAAGPITNGGQLEVRLSQMDEEIRRMRGAVEQAQFAERQQAASLKKLSEDVEFRFRTLEDKLVAKPEPSAVPAAAAAPEPAAADPEDAEVKPARFDPHKMPEDEKKGKSAEKPADKVALTGNDFPDANAHYAAAFKLLNEKKFSEAGSSFDAFVKKYPSDPLTANAFYWLGESYYARADYTRSAESFRKGFEANPQGQKAPDNLYKLAKSLGQVKRTNEACIVLAQISKKYSESAPRVVQKAEAERTSLACK